MTLLDKTQGSHEQRDNASVSFANLEDRGNALFVRINRAAGGAVPVLISREALEEHFGAGHHAGGQSDTCDTLAKDLAQAYVVHHESINAQALALDTGGDIYTNVAPMLLGCGDFS